MDTATAILEAIRRGGPGARDRLILQVYDELRGLAASLLAREKPGQTLQATALVHEAFLRLGVAGKMTFEDRRRFFAAAAEAMKRVLLDAARRKNTQKRGGGRRAWSIEAPQVAAEPPAEAVDLVALGEALEKLASEDPRKAELVKLRFFAGLDEAKAAEVMGISRATASRYWSYARAFLLAGMQDGPAPA